MPDWDSYFVTAAAGPQEKKKKGKKNTLYIT